jgi:hypothetical protein
MAGWRIMRKQVLSSVGILCLVAITVYFLVTGIIKVTDVSAAVAFVLIAGMVALATYGFTDGFEKAFGISQSKTEAVKVLKQVEQVFQDVWVERPQDEPHAAYWFTFTSKGAFTANYPVHVLIKLWITKGQEALLPLSFLFPDALVYPRRVTQGHPPEAPNIPVSFSSNEGAYIGEGDMEFTAAGQFGYIIFSQGKPVFYAAQKKIITISPVEVRTALSGFSE